MWKITRSIYSAKKQGPWTRLQCTKMVNSEDEALSLWADLMKDIKDEGHIEYPGLRYELIEEKDGAERVLDSVSTNFEAPYI